MKKLLFAIAAIICVTIQAEVKGLPAIGQISDKPKLTGPQLKTIYEKIEKKRTGGMLRRPETAKGWCVIINAQTCVKNEEIIAAAKSIDRQLHIQVKTTKGESVSPETARAELDKTGGQVGVIVVDVPSLPALLAAPEEAWALVNVSKLKDGSDSATLATRTRREILRGFALAAGGIHAAQGDLLLQPVRKPSDIDKIKREEYGVTLRKIFPLAFPYYGLTPWYETSYQKACQEGWAPAPTNEFQKAIWDKVHSIPSKPIKIEYDPKTDKK